MLRRISRLLGTAALLLLALVTLLAIVGGIVFVWVTLMQLAPQEWQVPATLVLAAVVFAAALSLLDVWTQPPNRR